MIDDGVPPNEFVLPPAPFSGVVEFTAFGGIFIQPGETWNFQVWTRDNNGSPCGGNNNLTNAYSVTFTP